MRVVLDPTVAVKAATRANGRRCEFGGGPCGSLQSAPGESARARPAVSRRSKTRRTAIEPSPTAAATRLIERLRTSPTQKMPGRLVSRTRGTTSADHGGRLGLIDSISQSKLLIQEAILSAPASWVSKSRKKSEKSSTQSFQMRSQVSCFGSPDGRRILTFFSRYLRHCLPNRNRSRCHFPRRRAHRATHNLLERLLSRNIP